VIRIKAHRAKNKNFKPEVPLYKKCNVLEFTFFKKKKKTLIDLPKIAEDFSLSLSLS